jgi:glycosyltransferase involved in cell wall biosynthesis
VHLTRFAGAVPHERVPGYLAAVDVAAAPYGETAPFYFSPLKLYEYLAAARPVAAADVGEINHCVVPGRTGSLYRPGDVDALADALETLLADHARAEAMGRTGREHVRTQHRWEATARAVVELARAGSAVGEAA